MERHNDYDMSPLKRLKAILIDLVKKVFFFQRDTENYNLNPTKKHSYLQFHYLPDANFPVNRNFPAEFQLIDGRIICVSIGSGMQYEDLKQWIKDCINSPTGLEIPKGTNALLNDEGIVEPLKENLKITQQIVLSFVLEELK